MRAKHNHGGSRAICKLCVSQWLESTANSRKQRLTARDILDLTHGRRALTLTEYIEHKRHAGVIVAL